MSLLNVGSRALLSNQIALQTAGHNIANVSVPGYSRQRAELTTENGQYTSAGYIGKGVNVQTIQRSYDAFLTKQATLASTLQAGDSTRSDYLKKLGDLFPTGSNGLGASINTMLNAFSDVASAPTDLTARTVALTQIDETASRMRTASQGIDELQTRTQGSGQPPNDLLDRRDQLIRELNGYVQTSSIPADDGSVGVFIAGSQALVLGTDVATLGIGQDDFGDRLGSKLTMSRPGTSVTLDEDNLGGGKMSGLLRFQNTDLTEGRNLLGRLTTAVTTAVNDQHRLGLDLDGKVGINLFSPTVFTPDNILQPTAPATLNTGNAVLNLSIADTSQFAASNYEVLFTSATTGSIIRKSDGLSTSFPQSPAPTAPILATLDGLNISMPSGTPAAGDRYLLKPFSTAAGAIQSQLASPRGLAVSNPLAASVSPTNQGTLSIVSLRTQTQASTAALPIDNHSVKFSVTAGVATYTIFDTTNSTVAGGPFSYVTGQTITHAPPGFTGFSLTLKGLPANNDTIQIQQNPYPTLNAGNASAIMALRDKPMFDGAPLSDGYASLIGQLGVRANSAELAANVSASIATSTEQSRATLSGVNLDEEAASLIQYQQAYQASAKIIQVAQGIFDSLLQAVSR
jgi:flagellar hook-associated protein 1 FlgK